MKTDDTYQKGKRDDGTQVIDQQEGGTSKGAGGEQIKRFPRIKDGRELMKQGKSVFSPNTTAVIL